MNEEINQENSPLTDEEQPVVPPMKRRFNKKIILLGLAFILAVLGAAGYWLTKRPNSNINEHMIGESAEMSPTELADKQKLRLIATGDFVFHDSLNEQAKLSDGSYDYLPFIKDMMPLFNNADVRFCNQVTPIGGVEFGISGYPKFNAPIEAISDMAEVGCNLVNMASNHSFDKSQAAISTNVEGWNKQQDILAVAGQNKSAAEQKEVDYFTLHDIKFAFLAYTTYINSSAPSQNEYGVNSYSREFAKSQVAEAKENGAEIIIVSMRWGTEYSNNINAQQKKEAQFLADLGVDIILGHGPHVLQPTQVLKGASGNDTIVWYSLGNFLHTQIETETLFNAIAVMEIEYETRRISIRGALPIYMYYEWTATQKNSNQLLARTNIKLLPLERATSEMFSKQQINTTAVAQEKRIKTIFNTFTEVPILSIDSYLD